MLKTNYFLLLILHCLYGKQLFKDHGMTCHSNRIDVHLMFDEPFDGIIFANQAFNDSACRWEGQHMIKMNFSIPIIRSNGNGSYACGITLRQATGEITSMLIISPMKNILVDGVTSLQIRCFYIISDITITMASLQLVGLEEQTGVVTGTGTIPTLQIQILNGHGIMGNVITHAIIGQPLTLDIVLENTEIYDFYAHSCTAHDGSKNSDAMVQIIDANGCGIGLPRAVESPVYITSPRNGNPKHVYIYMYGFQFTSSQFVYFECQARPCIRSCKRQQCEANKTVITDIRKPVINTTKPVIRSRRESQIKVVKLLTVLEMRPSQINADEFHSNPNTKSTSLRSTCPQLILLIAVFVMLSLMPTITIIVCYGIIIYRRRQMLNVQRKASFLGIHTESIYSSSSDN